MTKILMKHKYVKYMPKKIQSGIIYISKIHKVSIHKCACACGELSVLNLMKDGWKLEDTDNKISFTPSILNKPCKAHYYIKNNEVLWV